MTARSAIAAAALWLAAACTTTTGVVREEGAPDARSYHEPQDPAVQSAWGRASAAVRRGEFAAALPDLREVVERAATFVPGHLAYQDAALALGGDAEAAMRAKYAGLPDDGPVAAYTKARLLGTSYERGQALERLIKAHPSFAWGHLSLARARRGQGQLLVAADVLRTALRLDDRLDEARVERAEVLDELGRYEEAAAEYEAYLARVPADLAATRDCAAMMIYRIIRIDRALELLDRLDAAFPGDLELRMHRGAAMMRSKRPAEAAPHFLAVLEADPKASRAALNLGLLYYDTLARDDAGKRRYWPKARAAFRYFLALGNPQDGQEAFERTFAVPYRLGVIHDLLGGGDDAAPVRLDDLRPSD